MKEKKSVDIGKGRQWNMFCLSVVDKKGLEVIGKGFYFKKGKVGWKVFWDTRG